METRISTICLLLCAISLVTAGVASAELAVSVTLTGSVDELLPIIQHIKDMGIGVGLGADAEEALKLEVHSVMKREEASVVQAAEPEPEFGLLNPRVIPETPRPREEILITVEVKDREHRVDTVAGRFQKYNFDLRDNGTHGDQAAGDGIWSYAYTLPGSTSPGSYSFTVQAFDVHGNTVTREEEDGSLSPLVTTGTFTVSD